MKRTIFIVSIVVQTLTGWTQHFAAESDLPKVDRDGFYKIAVAPTVSSYMNSTFSNARIVGADGKEVPFVIETEKGVAAATTFLPYFIEEKSILPDSCTILVLKNNQGTSINNIHLVIKNAAVSKEAALYGSDDKIAWYALKDRFRLGYIESTEGTAEIKIIDFPASDYVYYKLWINDDERAPLNILRAGYYKNTTEEIKYQEVPIQSVTQKNVDKEKTSYVRISLDTLMTFGRISWEVEGLPFYQRTASLYTTREVTDRKGRKKEYRDHITSFQMNSRHEGIQYFSPTRSDDLLLEVANGDNPPLNIKNIKLYQEVRYLVAWLEKNNSYTLKFGDENMPVPIYDLAFFKDSIPSNLSVIEPAKVRPIVQALATNQTTFFTTKMFVWVAIAVVIVALGIMSVRMIRETNAARERQS